MCKTKCHCYYISNSYLFHKYVLNYTAEPLPAPEFVQ